MAVVSDFDFSVENIFFEIGGAGEEECEAGWEGTGDCCELGAGAGLDGPPMLREIVCGGGGWSPWRGTEKGLPGTNSNALALSLLMSRTRSDLADKSALFYKISIHVS